MKFILPLLILFASTTQLLANKDVSINTGVAVPVSGIIPDSAIISIPVVVHIVYNTAQQNISDAQVMSQLDVLNKDYRAKNDDRVNIPSYFAPLAGDAGIEFKLATIDPEGYSTNGIVRKQTGIKMFGTDDRIKSSANGGDNAWDRNKYLNIWVCNLAGGILGYTSALNAAADKDGVVIQYSVFGTIGTVSAPFNLGRTATHEIGHWLNLVHIWGDAYCGDDEVDDTPKQRASNRGRPTGEKFTCDMTGHGDMYMNFMDLTDDAGMFLFTRGQCKRMRAIFNAGGARREILASNALTNAGKTRRVETTQTAEAVKLITVFPNPAISTITVDLETSNNEVSTSITIYNSMGQPVMTQTITGSRSSINITSLKAGIYFIKQAQSNLMTKFIKN